MYTDRYQALRHRRKRATSVTGVFFTVTMEWAEYDVTTVHRGISRSEY